MKSENGSLKQSPEPVGHDAKYTAGTLHYTKGSLFVLFSWLIWGNLCFSLFESVGGPNILGLYLQDNYHVSNLQINILLNVIPMIIGTFMTPVISFKSDRTRSRLGRRIPFILFTIPFLVSFSIALGFTDEIIAFIKAHFPEGKLLSPFAAALIVIGFLTVGFAFFNEFVGTVYYYLCPDVVPSKFIGRFQGISQVFGTAVGFLINIYIVPYQLTHLKAIHVGVAILYFVGFGLLCWRVKEGQYPPVTDVTEKTSISNQVKLYFRECFSHRIFILFYLSAAATVLVKALLPAGVFGLHISQHQGEAKAAAVMALAMTPDGGRMVSGGRDGLLTLWDSSGMKTLLPLSVLTSPGGDVVGVAITADGRTVASGGSRGMVEIWDTTTGACLQRLTAHEGGVCRIALSPDGNRLASGGVEGTVRIWDVKTGRCLHTLSGHGDRVNGVAFSPRGEYVVSGGSDRTIIIWDAASGVRLKTLEGSPGPVYAVSFATALKSEEGRSDRPGPPTFVRSIGQAVFKNESLYDLPRGRQGDGMWVLSGGRDGQKDDENSSVRIWDASSGALVKTLKGHKQAVSCVAYKPDLQVVLSGSLDGSIRLWRPLAISDAATDQSFKTFSGYTRSVTAMACPRDGVKLVNAGLTGDLHIWNIDAGISLAKNGIMLAFFSIVSLLLAYPFGALVDRMNPLKLMMWAGLASIPGAFARYFWQHDYVSAMWISLINVPFNMLSLLCLMPVMIMIFPKTKYGQMSSANAMVRQFIAAVAGPAGAIFMDYLTAGSMLTDHFRYGFLFQGFAGLLSLLALLGVYYQWKKLGGNDYVAPESDGAKPLVAS